MWLLYEYGLDANTNRPINVLLRVSNELAVMRVHMLFCIFILIIIFRDKKGLAKNYIDHTLRMMPLRNQS